MVVVVDATSKYDRELRKKRENKGGGIKLFYTRSDVNQ